MTDGGGTVSYTYDSLNRLTETDRGADTFAYGYDGVGNVTSRTYPDSTQVIYEYDGANRMSSVSTGANTVSFGYDEAGNPTSVTRPGDVDSAYSWDSASRLVNIVHQKPSATYSSFAYTLDPVGNPTQIQTPTETIDLTYDLQDRLTQACYTPTCSGQLMSGISYTYDGI
jgi:YD repeat-containing protein